MSAVIVVHARMTPKRLPGKARRPVAARPRLPVLASGKAKLGEASE